VHRGKRTRRSRPYAATVPELGVAQYRMVPMAFNAIDLQPDPWELLPPLPVGVDRS
jgi:hypothetical protein